MQFLILSCNTGEGHNSAAKAVKEYIESRGDICDIRDALSFWSENNSKLISKGHVFIYRRLPKLFGIGYRFEEKHPPKEYDNSLMYDIVTKGCASLQRSLEESKYDAVICTHVFASMMMTELRLKNSFKMPTYFISTDYTCHPGTSESIVDRYFIAHPSLADDYVRCGLPREKLVASGIPIKEAFYTSHDKRQAKRLLKLPTDEKVILMMCGSMGCGPLEELTEDIPLMLPPKTRLVVICGNNRRLFKSITKKDVPYNMTVVGYTTRMPLYMDAADLILTKPGGLSTTEAANKHLPMIFIDAVPGCETHNLNFFVSRNFAAARSEVDELCCLVCDTIDRPDVLSKIKSALESEFTSHSAEIIYNTICEDIADANDRLQKIPTQ